MQPRSWLALLLLVPLLARAGGKEDQVDRLFADFTGAVPGASVLVARDGQLVYRQGYGQADLEAGVGATAATNFRLASLSKQFTAMAILQLAERQQLDLDDPLTTLFPEFPAYGKKITVRHLVHHTSGLRDYEDLIPASQSEQVSDRDVLGLYVKKTSSGSFPPGSQYRYCNGGYVLLGVIVEAVSGDTFPAYLQKNIFRPLGMRDSLAYVSDGPPIVSRAFGYTRRGNGFARTDQSVTSATLGDGGIYTSAADLLLWDQALATDFLLGPEYMAQLFVPGKLNGGGSTGYGFGWVVDTYGGQRRVSHTGSTIGFRTAIQRYLDTRLTVAVLVNRADASPWRTAEKVADIYLSSSR